MNRRAFPCSGVLDYRQRHADREESRCSEREKGKPPGIGRIVNLSDGSFAIALTLSVLDIRVPNIPENVVAAELPAALLSLWPKYLSYFLSFVAIAVFWSMHYSIFSGP